MKPRENGNYSTEPSLNPPEPPDMVICPKCNGEENECSRCNGWGEVEPCKKSEDCR